MVSGQYDRTVNRFGRSGLLLAVLLAVMALAFPAQAAPKFPALTGRVLARCDTSWPK